MTETEHLLDESRIPKAWCNIAADGPEPPPPVLHPGTKQPIGPDELAPLFPMALFEQGHGHFDMSAYDEYPAGKLEDRDYDAELLERALGELPEVG